MKSLILTLALFFSVISNASHSIQVLVVDKNDQPIAGLPVTITASANKTDLVSHGGEFPHLTKNLTVFDYQSFTTNNRGVAIVSLGGLKSAPLFKKATYEIQVGLYGERPLRESTQSYSPESTMYSGADKNDPYNLIFVDGDSVPSKVTAKVQLMTASEVLAQYAVQLRVFQSNGMVLKFQK